MLYDFENHDVNRLELERQKALEEEREAIREAVSFYDRTQEEQDEILRQTLRDMGMATEDEIEVVVCTQDDGPPLLVESITPGTETKEYATGVHPTMAEVTKANKYKGYSPYGQWDRREWDKDNWRNRFDDDERDGVCRDPYAYYSGDWY